MRETSCRAPAPNTRRPPGSPPQSRYLREPMKKRPQHQWMPQGQWNTQQRNSCDQTQRRLSSYTCGAAQWDRDAAPKVALLMLLLIPSITCAMQKHHQYPVNHTSLLVTTNQDFQLLPIHAQTQPATTTHHHQVVPAHYQPSFVFGARNHSVNLTRISLDELTGSVYVGATNWLFQLSSSSLEPSVALRTGPTSENPRDCAPADCQAPLQPTDPTLLPLYHAQSGDLSVPSSLGWRGRHWPALASATSTTSGTASTTANSSSTKPHYSNHNKLLVVEPESRQLLVCGSLSQGACRHHQLGQLANYSELVPLPVAANDEHSSTVGLVVVNSVSGQQKRPLLYVAATNTLIGQYRELVPAIAARHLEPGLKSLQIVERSVTEAARVDISLGQREYFQVNYVGAFQHSDYIYFATVQRKTHEHQLEDWGYHSRLARLCSGDLSFQSYIEVTLECGSSYNLLQDIYLAPAASHLSQQLGLTGAHSGHMVLVGVFARSREPHGLRPARKSAVCIYPMELVERRFRDNINLCYSGEIRSRNMNYIAGHLDECPKTSNKEAANVANFCSEPLKLNGSLAIRSQPVLAYDNELLTAVAVAQAHTAPLGAPTAAGKGEPAAGELGTSARQHQLLLLGTHDGYLKRVALTSGSPAPRGGTGLLRAHELDQLQVESQEPVLADLLLVSGSQSGAPGPQFALVATSGKLSKVRWDGCRASWTSSAQSRSQQQHRTGNASLVSAAHECQMCSHLNDPLCGWCSASQACTGRDECSHHWSPFDQIRCSDYQSIEPEAVPVQVSSAGPLVEVKVQASGLVGPTGQLSAPLAMQLAQARFLCHYDYQRAPPLNTARQSIGQSTSTNTKAQQARLNPATSTVSIACPLPAPAQRPPTGGDTRVRLSVRPLDAEPELRRLLGLTSGPTTSLERELTLYDCAQYTSCRTCVASDQQQQQRGYACAWCPISNRCTFNSSHAEFGCTAGALATTTPLSINGHHIKPAHLAASLDETQTTVLGLALDHMSQCPQQPRGSNTPTQGADSEGNNKQLVYQLSENSSLPVPPSANKWRELLVPSGSRKALQVPLERPIQELAKGVRLHKLECELELEGTRSRFAARLTADGQLVVCQENQFHYHEETATLRGQLVVVLNDNHPLESYDVLLYKCHLFGVNPKALASSIGQHIPSSVAWRADQVLRLAQRSPNGPPPTGRHHQGPQRSDCSLCMNVERRFQCQWCANQCQHADHCPTGLQASTCPPPRIDSIHPKAGPVEGGTLLTIEGSNLGSNEREIQDKISVGGEPCQLLVYSVSTRIVCRVGASAQGSYAATVFVGNRAGVTSAHEKFHYEAVHLADVQPRIGPVSGGTRLTLTGSNLRTGSRTQVYLDDLPCALIEDYHDIQPNQISCITEPYLLASSMRITRLTLVIDNSTHYLPYPFTYQPDPIITSIEPTESFVSGGRLILISGQHLASPLVTKLVVYDEHNPSRVNSTNCYPQNDTLRTCLTPALDPELFAHSMFASLDTTGASSRGSSEPHSSRLSHASGGLKLKMSLYMDDVRSVRNLDEYYHHLPHHITYFEDPQLFRLPQPVVDYTPELVISGENLQMKQLDQDMIISVGDKSFCQIKSLSSQQVVCVPPAKVPPALDEQGYLLERHSLPIRALIGDNLRFDLGYMQYNSRQYLPLSQMELGQTGTSLVDLQNSAGSFDQNTSSLSSTTSGGITLLIILSVLGFVLGLGAFVVFARSSFRQSKAEREYRRIQLQMGSLDINKTPFNHCSGGLFSGGNFHGFQGVPNARLKALDSMMNGVGATNSNKKLFHQPLFCPTTNNHLGDISTLMGYKASPHHNQQHQQQQHLVKLSSDGTIVNTTSIPARHLYSSTGGDSSSSSQSSPSSTKNYHKGQQQLGNNFCNSMPESQRLQLVQAAGGCSPVINHLDKKDLLATLSGHLPSAGSVANRNYSWTQEAPSTIVPYAVIETCQLSLENGKPPQTAAHKDYV